MLYAFVDTNNTKSVIFPLFIRKRMPIKNQWHSQVAYSAKEDAVFYKIILCSKIAL